MLLVDISGSALNMNDDIEKLLETGVTSVFGTMLNLTVEREPLPGNPFEGQSHFAVNVGLTGAVNGMIYIYLSTDFARKVTGIMLQMPEPEIDTDMVKDVMGELTNMIGGTFKNALSNQSARCLLTVPSVVIGTEFRVVNISGSVRKSIYIRSGEGHVMLEAIMKAS